MLLEAGRHFREVKKTIGYATSSISGCIVSHEHGDHAKYIPEYLKAGIDVYSNDKVAEKYSGVKAVSMGGTFQIGDFKVTPFDVEHDVVNYGYLIHHPTLYSSQQIVIISNIASRVAKPISWNAITKMNFLTRQSTRERYQ